MKNKSKKTSSKKPTKKVVPVKKFSNSIGLEKIDEHLQSKIEEWGLTTDKTTRHHPDIRVNRIDSLPVNTCDGAKRISAAGAYVDFFAQKIDENNEMKFDRQNPNLIEDLNRIPFWNPETKVSSGGFIEKDILKLDEVISKIDAEKEAAEKLLEEQKSRESITVELSAVDYQRIKRLSDKCFYGEIPFATVSKILLKLGIDHMEKEKSLVDIEIVKG